MDKPYVVSADVYLLMKQWAGIRGFTLPSEDFWQTMRRQFFTFMSQIFPSLDLVSEQDLSQGLKQIVSASGLLPISLDRVYFQTDLHLDITRLVDQSGRDKGLGSRVGRPVLRQQFFNLREKGLTEVVLVDDVVFTGDLIARVIHCLDRIGIRVPLVCAGIGIARSINQLNHFRCELRCVRRYQDVIDEVCERDFYPGVPSCGRSVVGGVNVGIPYLLPFGDPGKWASIPAEWQMPFSKFCVNQAIYLFKAIEKCSNRIVTCAELDRGVMTLPQDQTRFVDALAL